MLKEQIKKKVKSKLIEVEREILIDYRYREGVNQLLKNIPNRMYQ